MLTFLKLEALSGMRHIFKGPKHMWSLPQLNVLVITNCEALEKIVEEDEQNQNISNPCFCFPQLKRVIVKNCNKLKHLFRMNTANEFSKLQELVIMEASDLEEVFAVSDECEREEAMQNNVRPKLKLAMLVELPSLANVWPYKLQTVEHRIVVKCPKLSLTSTITIEDLEVLSKLQFLFLCSFIL